MWTNFGFSRPKASFPRYQKTLVKWGGAVAFAVFGTDCAAKDPHESIALIGLKQAGSKVYVGLALVNQTVSPICFSALHATVVYPEIDPPISSTIGVTDFGRVPGDGKLFVLAPGATFQNTTVVQLMRVSDVDQEEWLGFGDQEGKAKADYKAFLRKGRFGLAATLLTFKCPSFRRVDLPDTGLGEITVKRYLGRDERNLDLGDFNLRIRE